ncbi:MAG: ABC transporter substrate-binding protein [Phycisphaerales bacterium JB063]
MSLLRPVFALFVGLGLFFLVGCGGSSSGGAVIGFAQGGSESSWREAETESIKSAAKEAGYDLRYANAEQRPDQQVSQVRGFIAQGVDVIIISPIEKTGWEEVLGEARDAGIPVVLVDRGIDTEDETLYSTLIASDFVEEGRMAANWLVENKPGGANIVELAGLPGADPAIDRKKGFAEVIDATDGFTIIESQAANFQRAEGKDVMTALLQRSDLEIDVVYAHNDDMALGAIEAIKAQGLTLGEDIIVISIDGVRAAFESMAAGELSATVECNPLLGPKTMEVIAQLLAGEEVPHRIVSEDKLYEASQAAEALPNRGY